MVALGVGAFRPDLISWKDGYRHSFPPGASGVGPLIPVQTEPTPGDIIRQREKEALARCEHAVTRGQPVLLGRLMRPSNEVAVTIGRRKLAHALSCEKAPDGSSLFSAPGIASLMHFSSPEQVMRAINALGKDWGRP